MTGPGPAAIAPGLAFRRARATDAPAIAALQIDSWQDAYAGLLDARFLDRTLPDALRGYWRGAVVDRDPRNTIHLAEDDGGLAGFVALGRADASATDAFVDHLHVRPGLRGKGLGRRLLGLAATDARAQGRRAAYLTVLATNARAIAFYRRLGGCPGPPFADTILGLSVTALRVDWPDIHALADACAARG